MNEPSVWYESYFNKVLFVALCSKMSPVNGVNFITGCINRGIQTSGIKTTQEIHIPGTTTRFSDVTAWNQNHNNYQYDSNNDTMTLFEYTQFQVT